MRSWDEIKALMENKKININNYVVLVPLNLYERLLAEAEHIEEDERPLLYYTGVRIMWDAHITKPLLVHKDLYNVKYNSCSFVKVI